MAHCCSVTCRRLSQQWHGENEVGVKAEAGGSPALPISPASSVPSGAQSDRLQVSNAVHMRSGGICKLAYKFRDKRLTAYISIYLFISAMQWQMTRCLPQ